MDYVRDVFDFLSESMMCAQSDSEPSGTHKVWSCRDKAAFELTTPAASMGKTETHSTTSSASSVLSIDHPKFDYGNKNISMNLNSWADHADETFMKQKRRVAEADFFYRQQLEQRQQIAEDISKFKREQLQQPSHLKLRDEDFKFMLKQKLSDFTKMDFAVKAARREIDELKNATLSRKSIAVFRRNLSPAPCRIRSVSPLKQQGYATQVTRLERNDVLMGRFLSPPTRQTQKRIDSPCARRASSAE
jgi:hypothetical protein